MTKTPTKLTHFRRRDEKFDGNDVVL